MAKERIIVAGELYEGITGQLFEIGRQLRQPNGYPFDPQALRRYLQNAIEGRFESVATNVFRVMINYDLSVEDAVKAGKYDWKDNNILSKNFPSKREGMIEAEIILVHFNCDMDSDDALRELNKQGLRPAELPELTAFGAKYPDVQRDFPIIALASVWQSPRGFRGVPYLCRDSGARFLSLFWFDSRWSSRCRFAALRK